LGFDVDPFVAAVAGRPIPEPSALLLPIVALGVVGEWWKWKLRGVLTAAAH
jgi:hypothetical protein